MTSRSATEALRRLSPDKRAAIVARIAELAALDQLVRERPVTSQGGRR